MPTELEELEVDRVDAVDDPATGHKFLLLKTDDPDEIEANLQSLAVECFNALRAVAKGKVELDRLSAKKLSKIAKMLGVKGLTLTIRKERDEEEPAKVEASASGTKTDAAQAGKAEAQNRPWQAAQAGKAEAKADAPTISLAKESLDALKGVTDSVKELKKFLSDDDDDERDDDDTSSRTSREPKRKEVESAQLQAGNGKKLSKSGVPKFGEGMFDNLFAGDPNWR